MFHASKGLIFWRRTIRYQILFNGDRILVGEPILHLWKQKNDWLTHPRRMVFMWALPMTSLAANVRSPFLRLRGGPRTFNYPFKQGYDSPPP